LGRWDYLRGALGWERRANLRTTNKARSHTHTSSSHSTTSPWSPNSHPFYVFNIHQGSRRHETWSGRRSGSKGAAHTIAHGRSRPLRWQRRRAEQGNGKDVADEGGAAIAHPPTTTVRSTRRWWRAHRVDLSLRAPPPTECAIGRSWAAAWPILWAARRCLKTPMRGPFPRVRLRADSHMPAIQCCAARNPPQIGSQRRLVAPAARQQGGRHCERIPLHDRSGTARQAMRQCL